MLCTAPSIIRAATEHARVRHSNRMQLLAEQRRLLETPLVEFVPGVANPPPYRGHEHDGFPSGQVLRPGAAINFARNLFRRGRP